MILGLVFLLGAGALRVPLQVYSWGHVQGQRTEAGAFQYTVAQTHFTAGEIRGAFPLRENLPVYYNPTDPGDAFVLSVPRWLPTGLLVSSLLFLLCAGLSAYRGGRQQEHY